MTSLHRISASLNTNEDEIYVKISNILHDLSGINLGPEKINLMRARLIKRMRETGVQNIADYLDLLNSPSAHEEFPHLISALTTNYTNFFREPHHFKVLIETVLPALEARGARTINIWSAGCSSGQEPVSIAITLADRLGTAFHRVRILGTDIDREILTKASSFSYQEQEVSGIPRSSLIKYFRVKQQIPTRISHQ
ncbi:CheR family methyltransferase [Paracoccus cavernae]|uniref:protein-glutamate O-methyltransferase n=1 Tax=Paracoccus cavernae TaxID=1571207 RepID=A0ABT8D5C5_9RHOB|nr:CheR family methyltransferase [Paracoccus cavernae]